MNNFVRRASRIDDEEDEDDEDNEGGDDLKAAGSINNSHGASSNSSFSILAYMSYWKSFFYETTFIRGVRRVAASSRYSKLYGRSRIPFKLRARFTLQI